MVEIRTASSEDAVGINEIGNYYIDKTVANFKTERLSIKERENWIGTFSNSGRYRLAVATDEKVILGYACSSIYYDRSAYQTSVTTSIYLQAAACAKGLGTQLYSYLFELLAGEDIKRAYAGITLPNEASQRFHAKFGFKEVGIFTQAGRKYGKYWDVLWMEKPM
jgi:phosphinothricin acetyltransferase